MRAGSTLETFVKGRNVAEGVQLIPSETPEDKVEYIAIIWGDNNYGQLGRPPSELPYVSQDHPLKIPGVRLFSFGEGSSYMVKTDGTVWVAGRNNKGQLGLGHTNDVHEWTQIV
jgi:alpha-tubulin suppressor-like RCC1 family protein